LCILFEKVHIMFSYSSNPINLSSQVNKLISFHELVGMIKNPVKIDNYTRLHHLKLTQPKEECRKFKQNHIPWVTPNALVRKRELRGVEDFKFNFIQSSGYVYFDIDDVEGNVDEFKNTLIQKLGNIVSLISKSSTNKGISILVRVNVTVSSTEEFELLYDYVSQTYFHDLNLDRGVRRLSTAWFIPYDSDVFVNHDSIINIPDGILKGSHNVLLTHPNTNIYCMNPQSQSPKKRNKHEYIELSIREVFEKCNLETPVHFDGDYLISPTPIVSIQFPKVIYDGSKRGVFRKVIHNLMTLNPDFTISHVYLFLNHINENFAKPKMEVVSLKNLVESQFDFIREHPNYQNKSKKTLRSIHYKNRGNISTKKKRELSNRFRGLMERYSTYKRIGYAINYLLDEHYTYTNKQISELIGVSISTVKRNLKLKKEDFEREFREFNKEIQEVLNTDFNNFSSQTES
jgi:hypothetical protein